MTGIVLVDKPQGITSFDVVRRLRRLCGNRQVGHCGTLDPLATGLLPVAVGPATRLVEYLMADEKEYLATFVLGTVTDTQDSTGRVLASNPWDAVSLEALNVASQTLTGVIEQVPPMYSALKRDGVPLYKLARQGCEVTRAPRPVTISLIELLEFTPPRVAVRVVCSKGTYIRTLIHDLGAQLGCGACLTALRRTRCGRFGVADALTPDALAALTAAGEALPLLSPATAMSGYPGLTVRPEAWSRLANGIAPRLAEVEPSRSFAPGDLVCLLAEQRLVAVARFSPEGVEGRPGDFSLQKVFPEAILAG